MASFLLPLQSGQTVSDLPPSLDHTALKRVKRGKKLVSDNQKIVLLFPLTKRQEKAVLPLFKEWMRSHLRALISVECGLPRLKGVAQARGKGQQQQCFDFGFTQ